MSFNGGFCCATKSATKSATHRDIGRYPEGHNVRARSRTIRPNRRVADGGGIANHIHHWCEMEDDIARVELLPVEGDLDLGVSRAGADGQVAQHRG